MATSAADKVNRLVQKGRFSPLAFTFTYDTVQKLWTGGVVSPFNVVKTARTKQEIRAMVAEEIAAAFPDVTPTNIPLPDFLRETKHDVRVEMHVNAEGYSGKMVTSCATCSTETYFSLPDSSKLSKEIKAVITRTCPKLY